MCGSSNEASYRNWEGESLTSDTAELSGIRILNFLQPSTTSTPDHSYSPRRQVKYSVDHTLYLYPVSLEKFEHRYLMCFVLYCARIFNFDIYAVEIYASKFS